MQIVIDIQLILRQAQQNAYRSINKAMLEAYWLVGKRIVEEEQQGESRAVYGDAVMKTLSEELQREFGKGFSIRNIEQMRVFYLEYSIPQTVSAELQMPDFQLSWSHYQLLLRIENEEERRFYEIEAAKSKWSLRELKRQFDSALYLRLALSTDKEGIKALLELGKGFIFVARQKRITFDEKNFYIDLVFYNRLLRCFVVLDLKIGELRHQDLGQMQMYVNYYDRHVKVGEENKTIGIILCQSKSDVLVEITLPEDNQQIFASRYQTILPSKAELKTLLEQHQQIG